MFSRVGRSQVLAQTQQFVRSRFASTLVYVDHDGATVAQSTLRAVTAASKIGGDITAFVAGPKAVADAAAKINGVKQVINVANDFKGQLAEAVTPALLSAQEKHSFTHIIAAATTSGKNILPRLAAKLDVAMISEITDVKGEDTFTRPIYAGNALLTLKSKDSVKVITVRGTAFGPCESEGGSAAVEDLAGTDKVDGSEFVSQELQKSDRPSLTAAEVVVCGGRGLKSEENFVLMEQLADKLGAAVGATRAAVDAGYASNDKQIGQTGQTVSPKLYIGAGVSGAIQHLAGMKDSQTIVVINKDEEAPFFQVADYGLVADLFKAVPEITEKL